MTQKTFGIATADAVVQFDLTDDMADLVERFEAAIDKTALIRTGPTTHRESETSLQLRCPVSYGPVRGAWSSDVRRPLARVASGLEVTAPPTWNPTGDEQKIVYLRALLLSEVAFGEPSDTCHAGPRERAEGRAGRGRVLVLLRVTRATAEGYHPRRGERIAQQEREVSRGGGRRRKVSEEGPEQSERAFSFVITHLVAFSQFDSRMNQVSKALDDGAQEGGCVFRNELKLIRHLDENCK